MAIGGARTWLRSELEWGAGPHEVSLQSDEVEDERLDMSSRASLSIPLPPGAGYASAVLAVVGFLHSPDGTLAIAAAACLLIGLAATWRPGEAPILLYLIFYHWLQAATLVVQSSVTGEPLYDFIVMGRSVVSPEALHHATLLSLLGVASLAVGMRVGAGNPSADTNYFAKVAVLRRKVDAVFVLYAFSALFAGGINAVAWLVPGLAQPLVALAGFKWTFFWLLAFRTFVAKTSTQYFVAAFIVEFLVSIGGFFADFRSVFVITACALLAAGVKLKKGALVALVAVFLSVIFLAALWTSIKTQYREFVSGGLATQAVTVGVEDRTRKLIELVSDVDGQALLNATVKLAERFAYVEIFAAVLETVPSLIPHEGGLLWVDAVSRPLMPRLLFPDKAVLDDSQQVNKYSAIKVSGTAEATSFSIGYIGETYIDFGAYGIAPVLSVWGLVIGWIYRWLLYGTATRGALGMGLACAVFLPIAPLETSLAKTVGLLATTSLVAVVVSRWIVPRFCGWLQVKPAPR